MVCEGCGLAQLVGRVVAVVGVEDKDLTRMPEIAGQVVNTRFDRKWLTNREYQQL